MSWQVVDRMTIYHESGMYALSPTVTRTPAGSLLVTFQRATYLGYSHHEHPLFNVQSCRSEDEGRTWTGPHLVTVDQVVDPRRGDGPWCPHPSGREHLSTLILHRVGSCGGCGRTWGELDCTTWQTVLGPVTRRWAYVERSQTLSTSTRRGLGTPRPALRGQSERLASPSRWTPTHAEQGN